MNEPLVSEQWRSNIRASQRSLLAAEALLLARLRAALRIVTAQNKTARDPIDRVARQLLADLPAVIAAGRADSRRASLSAVERDVADLRTVLVSKGVADLPAPPAPSHSSRDDEVSAITVAQSFVMAWLATARKQDPKATPSVALARTNDAVSWRIERIAATENAQAFQDEREDATEALFRATPTKQWLGAIFKTWDATLDRATCAVCRAIDGQWRPWGFSFDGGARPGFVHANCRCVEGMFVVPFYRTQEAA